MLDVQDPNEARKIIRDNKYTEQTAVSYAYLGSKII